MTTTFSKFFIMPFCRRFVGPNVYGHTYTYLPKSILNKQKNNKSLGYLKNKVILTQKFNVV